MSSNQNFWLDKLEELGGRFWPPSLEEKESEMPEVGAKYPMMLYNADMEVIVYDDEDYKEAKKNGYNEHPSLVKAGAPAEPPKPEPKPEEAPKPTPPPPPPPPQQPAASVTVEKKVTVTPPPRPASSPPTSKK